jgi:hypothetical protein
MMKKEQSLDPSAWAILLSPENVNLRPKDVIALRSTCRALREMASPLIKKLRINSRLGHLDRRGNSITPINSTLLDHIKNLEIIGSDKYFDAFLAILKRCAPNLEVLDISGGELAEELLMSDEYGKPTLSFPNVKSLFLDEYGEHLISYSLETLNAMPQLEYLSLRDGLSTDDVKLLAEADFVRNLKGLDLGRPDDRYWRGYSTHDGLPEDDVMEAINTILKRATKLQELTVRGQRSVAFFTDSNTTNLTDVCILGCQIVENFTMPSSVLRLEINDSAFEYDVAVDLFTSGKSLSQVESLRVTSCEFIDWGEEEETYDWKKIIKKLQMPMVETIYFEGYSEEDVVRIAGRRATISRLRGNLHEDDASEDTDSSSEDEDGDEYDSEEVE